MNNDFFNISPDCEIVTTRVMNAPREIIFHAWTDPAILQEWWGPAGFTNTFYEFNPVPGGTWKFMMHGPEKGNYPNEVVFLKVEEPSLIAWDRISQPHFRVVTTFEAVEENKTKLVFRMQFNSREECDKLRKFVPEKNEENFDKLEMALTKMVSADSQQDQ
jgi:uncharacterized protein YndB with AHSA1/START domain